MSFKSLNLHCQREPSSSLIKCESFDRTIEIKLEQLEQSPKKSSTSSTMHPQQQQHHQHHPHFPAMTNHSGNNHDLLKCKKQQQQHQQQHTKSSLTKIYHHNNHNHNHPLPTSVARRNERERNRVKMVNMGFATLREHVPNGAKNKKMSKVETLRSAVEYIRQLQLVLGHSANENSISAEQYEQLFQAANSSGGGADENCYPSPPASGSPASSPQSQIAIDCAMDQNSSVSMESATIFGNYHTMSGVNDHPHNHHNNLTTTTAMYGDIYGDEQLSANKLLNTSAAAAFQLHHPSHHQQHDHHFTIISPSTPSSSSSSSPPSSSLSPSSTSISNSMICSNVRASPSPSETMIVNSSPYGSDDHHHQHHHHQHHRQHCETPMLDVTRSIVAAATAATNDEELFDFTNWF